MLVIIAVFAPVFATHDPIQTMIGVPGETGRLPSKPPCIPILGCEEPQHILGLDLNARDLYSRVIYGTRTSLSVGVVTISLSIIAGTALGITSGYLGGGQTTSSCALWMWCWLSPPCCWRYRL